MANTPPSSNNGTVKSDDCGCKAEGGTTLSSCIISLGNKKENSSLCGSCEDVDVTVRCCCDRGGVATRGEAAIEGGAAIGGGATIGDGTAIEGGAISPGGAKLLSMESRQNDTFFLMEDSCLAVSCCGVTEVSGWDRSRAAGSDGSKRAGIVTGRSKSTPILSA